MDAGRISQFDFLVREIATEKVGKIQLSDFKKDCLSCDYREATFNSLVSGLEFSEEDIGNHINYWTYDKLRAFAKTAGFECVIRSKFQGCISQDMKGPDFDTTRPEMSLYVDLIKQ